MSTWIALLRGINVGGRNTIKMDDLRELLKSLGFSNARTYIQSGNVVFDAPNRSAAELGDMIADAVEKSRGFRPSVHLVTPDRFERAIEENPYPEADDAPKSVHLFFLASSPSNPELEKLDALRAPTERFHLADDVFYLHAPNGIGRSKLASSVERTLGVGTTARNWRTCRKLQAMLSDAT